MTAQEEGARTATNGPGADSTVPVPPDSERDERRAKYQAREYRRQHRRHVQALDRHIASTYGSGYLRRSA